MHKLSPDSIVHHELGMAMFFVPANDPGLPRFAVALGPSAGFLLYRRTPCVDRILYVVYRWARGISKLHAPVVQVATVLMSAAAARAVGGALAAHELEGGL